MQKKNSNFFLLLQSWISSNALKDFSSRIKANDVTNDNNNNINNNNHTISQ
jgi:hypothetical protein